jgi:hypothetical protein
MKEFLWSGIFFPTVNPLFVSSLFSNFIQNTRTLPKCFLGCSYRTRSSCWKWNYTGSQRQRFIGPLYWFILSYYSLTRSWNNFLLCFTLSNRSFFMEKIQSRNLWKLSSFHCSPRIFLGYGNQINFNQFGFISLHLMNEMFLQSCRIVPRYYENIWEYTTQSHTLYNTEMVSRRTNQSNHFWNYRRSSFESWFFFENISFSALEIHLSRFSLCTVSGNFQVAEVNGSIIGGTCRLCTTWHTRFAMMRLMETAVCHWKKYTILPFTNLKFVLYRYSHFELMVV